MSSCCEAPKSSQSPSSKGDTSSKSVQKGSGVTSWLGSFAPVFSALLHCSCCWLPTLLDLTSIGSASAATISSLRPVLLSITVLILLDSIRRQGLNRHNLLRIFASVLVLLPRPFHTHFWSSRLLWKRAGINTLARVTGCTLGGLSTLWFLQSQHPGLGIYAIMGLSTVTAAAGLSLASILSMEVVENIVDYHSMAGMVDFADPKFWAAAAISSCVGFLAPLPYNSSTNTNAFRGAPPGHSPPNIQPA
ncbi:hypothetical protein BGZ57DRAFT_1012081 [Hyaloscypha finlandica]|nr:hypothetical protein BGZ57DRAFT_1012081 [Hyaloscypha finlandica]